MTDLQFVVDTTQLDKAITATNKIEREIRKLAKAEQSGAISTDQYTKRVGQLASKLQSVTGGNIRARKSVYDYSVTTREAAKETAKFTTEVSRSNRQMQTYGNTVRNTKGYINQFGENVEFSGKRVNRMGQRMQQVGYQVGDFAVQVQGGTNMLVALGQQGAQLLGIFGAGGAIAGAALAITTALIIPFTRGEEKAEKLVDRIKDLKNEIRDLKGITLPEEFEQSATLADEVYLKILQAEDRLAKLQDTRDSMRLQSGEAYNEIVSQITIQERHINDLQEDRQKLVDRQQQYSQAALERARLLGEQEERNLQREIALQRMVLQFGEDSNAVRELEKQHALEIYEEDLKRQGIHPSIIEGLMQQKKVALDLQKVMSGISKEAQQIALNLGISVLEAQSRLNQQQSKVYGGRGSAGLPGGKTVNSLGQDGIQEIIDRFNKKARAGRDKETEADYLEKLERQIKAKKDLVGLFGQERDVAERVAQLREQVIDKEFSLTGAQLEGIAKREKAIEDQLRKQEELYNSFESSINSGLMDMVTGAKSVEQAFKDSLFNIVSAIYEQMVIDPIANAGASLLSGLIGFSKGGVISGGTKAFSTGGVVENTTLFPMSKGRGMMGEAGPEAVMPLKKMSNGRLGVESSGNTSGGTTVVQVQLSPELIGQILSEAKDQSVDIVSKASPGIVDKSVQSMMDKRRRGGAAKATFG